MRALLSGWLLACCLVSASAVFAAQPVRVGAYDFPPYVVKPESNQPTGLVPDLLAQLNQAQQAFRFSLMPTSVTRRYRDLQGSRFDMILFESPKWGWQDTEHKALDLHIEDAEVYVARAQPGRGQEYFEHINDKRLALYTGYHYGFAGFNSDPQYLRDKLGAVLTYSHDSNLNMLLRGRADIAVITRSYLEMYQDNNPELRSELLVSERVDQIYQHQALFRPHAPLSPRQFADLLQVLNRDGGLDALLARYHMRATEAFGGD
nr:transporter substrate-binding domain-containing protein [uncultured Pseudomonas sp.]